MLLIPDLGLDMSINTENQFEYAPFDIINYFHSELLKLYNDYDTVSEPLKGKDRRLRLILSNSKKKKKEIKNKLLSYPKAIKEVEIKRKLVGDETVDHIDSNFENDTIDNLQILSRSENARKDAIKVIRKSVKCSFCGKEFIPTRGQTRKLGVFCSRVCSGKYGKLLQYNKIEPAKKVKIIKVYYK